MCLFQGEVLTLTQNEVENKMEGNFISLQHLLLDIITPEK